MKSKGHIKHKLLIEHPPKAIVEELSNHLTFKNPQYALIQRFSRWGYSTQVPEYICLAQTTKNGSLLLPRGLDLSKLSLNALNFFDSLDWTDERTSAPVKFPKLALPLAQTQSFMLGHFKKAVASLERPFGTYLMVMPTGTGKSILQASMAAYTGQRTLILFPTNLTFKSWVDDLMRAFSLDRSDIGLIQQSKWELGEHFTLASIQTLARRKPKWPELFSQIGCLIIDEAQIAAAPQAYNFIQSCPAKVIIAASATPDPKTGGFYVSASFGPPLKVVDNQQKETDTSLPLKDAQLVKTRFSYEYERASIDFNDLLENMAVDEDRNNIAVKTTKKLWLAGHCCLVATKRVTHAYLLKEMLTEAGISDVFVLTGQTPRSEQESTVKAIFEGKCRCLVATIQAIKVGANINPLDRLICTMPVNRNDLEQLIGRIRRKFKGKTDCALYYMLDDRTGYLHRYFTREVLATLRKLRVGDFKNWA